MSSIPDEFLDLFEKPTIAHVATVMPDGTPHNTPVWIGYDADTGHLLVNTETGRRKERNVAENPKVGVSMVDPENAYRRLSVMGEVEEVTTDGARDHIDQLSRRYTGEDYDPDMIQTERVLLRIRVDEVMAEG
jgi:PPOX class probable F420-dependent enzyme